MTIAGGASLDDFRRFIAASRWIFAKTMPLTPHEYTLRREARDEVEFERFVVMIREEGVADSFEGREYVYLQVDGHKYWTMGSPVDETILINRAVVVERVPGPD
jgi:hypothetical protein